MAIYEVIKLQAQNSIVFVTHLTHCHCRGLSVFFDNFDQYKYRQNVIFQTKGKKLLLFFSSVRADIVSGEINKALLTTQKIKKRIINVFLEFLIDVYIHSVSFISNTVNFQPVSDFRFFSTISNTFDLTGVPKSLICCL